MDSESEQDSRILLSRCLRETLCERLVGLGVVEHIGKDNYLVERIIQEIGDREALDNMSTESIGARKPTADSGGTATAFEPGGCHGRSDQYNRLCGRSRYVGEPGDLFRSSRCGYPEA